MADLEKHSDIENVLVRHEHSGVALAYATARISGRPAVCYGNPGPGITNMATALLEATSASLPVVALTNGVPLSPDGKGAFQELDSVSHMRPGTKWATRVVSAETVPWVMRQAFSIAKNGRPGAVFVDVPSDLGLATASIGAYRPSLPRHRSRPDAAAVEAAAGLLSRAKTPLAICGSGTVSAGAAAPVRSLAEALGMRVFTTPGGRGVFPEGHELALGRIGLYFTELGKEYFDRADVVLAVGSRLEDFSTGGWQLWPKRARLIQIDFDPEAIHLNQEPEVALVGDAALALDDVIAALPPCAPPTRDRRLHRLAEKRTPFLARAEAEAKETWTPILTRQ